MTIERKKNHLFLSFFSAYTCGYFLLPVMALDLCDEMEHIHVKCFPVGDIRSIFHVKSLINAQVVVLDGWSRLHLKERMLFLFCLGG